jgi:ubiquinone/menaquinone biosynthesis C-methylase UbiE
MRPEYFSNRYDYQQQHIDFQISSGDKVLDIGSGNYPFPHATLLADRYIEPTRHRSTDFQFDGKPIVITDIDNLPFGDKSFDYVYCAHLLEHVENPIQACAEIMRVGKRGYIETPTLAKEMLFAWAKGMHKWYLVNIQNNLCFFEYSERRLEGIRSTAWRDLIRRQWSDPLQEAFYTNQDVFNIMFTWEDYFSVFVFYLDGSIKTLHQDKQ